MSHIVDSLDQSASVSAGKEVRKLILEEIETSSQAASDFSNTGVLPLEVKNAACHGVMLQARVISILEGMTWVMLQLLI